MRRRVPLPNLSGRILMKSMHALVELERIDFTTLPALSNSVRSSPRALRKSRSCAMPAHSRTWRLMLFGMSGISLFLVWADGCASARGGRGVLAGLLLNGAPSANAETFSAVRTKSEVVLQSGRLPQDFGGLAVPLVGCGGLLDGRPGWYITVVTFTIELEREEDGRWIAEVPTLPGVLCYGKDRDEAVAGVQALALRVIAERLEQREAPAEFLNVTFHAA
jgi:predicted RNase H-like HicB family nuclease